MPQRPYRRSPCIVDKFLRFVYFAIQSENSMNDFNKALGDINSICRQPAHATEFRGYGCATLAVTGILVVAATVAQSIWLPDPANYISACLTIWIWTAALSAAVIAIEMYGRTRRTHSGLADEMIRMAVEQFLPSGGLGGLVTITLVRFNPGALGTLLGLWQVIFSHGVFSSCRFLPHAVASVGAWYLLTGLTSLALADTRALSPWAVGISYGVGQIPRDWRLAI